MGPRKEDTDCSQGVGFDKYLAAQCNKWYFSGTNPKFWFLFRAAVCRSCCYLCGCEHQCWGQSVSPPHTGQGLAKIQSSATDREANTKGLWAAKRKTAVSCAQSSVPTRVRPPRLCPSPLPRHCPLLSSDLGYQLPSPSRVRSPAHRGLGG